MKGGIKFKLLFSVGITSLALYILVFGYLIFNSRSLSLGLSEEVISQYAWRNANHTKAVMNRDLGIAQGMAASVNQYIDLDSAQREAAIAKMLSGVLSLDKRFYASWLSLELKNIDSAWDKSYGRKRYTFYQQGAPVIEKINLEGDDPTSTYYQLKQSRKEVINDPYDLNKYNYSGDKRNNIFGTSLCVPVIRNGEFAGLVGMDMTLDIFNYITTIKPYETASSFLLSNDGTVVAHENIAFRGKKISDVLGLSREIQDSVKRGVFISRLIIDPNTGDEAFMILTPVEFGTSQQPWAAGTIVPRKELTSSSDRIFLIAILFGLCGLIILILVVTVIAGRIAKPIVQSSAALNDLAKGNVDVRHVLVDSNDELGKMSQSVEALILNLKEKVSFAEQIGSGNLNVKLDNIRSEDKLGKALQEMRDSLHKNAEQSAIRNWVTEGLAKFGDLLRQNSENQDDFYFSIIKNLVVYLDANQGAIFILEESDKDKDPYLLLKAAYAYERKKYLEKRIEIGQGLVGQCFLEGRTVYLKDIPKNYIRITSGLGDAPPNTLLMVPLTLNGESLGVIEIASFKTFKEHEIDFTNKVAEAIASSIASFNVANKTKELLANSRQREEELRSAEEEMRQSMEELESTQEGMKRFQLEMQDSESKMKAVINGTNDSILVFDQSYKIVLINDVLKKRYQGTQYQMDVGDNLLEKLGKDSDTWEEYYEKVFQGEKLEFTIQSKLQNENSRRHYDMIPIYGQDGGVKYCLVITRDEKGLRTDAFENETELRQAAKLKEIISSSHPVVRLDKDLNIIWANSVFAEITRMSTMGNALPFDSCFQTNHTLAEIKSGIRTGMWRGDVSLGHNGQSVQVELLITPLDESFETFLGLAEVCHNQ